jgi:hypothetical protein
LLFDFADYTRWEHYVVRTLGAARLTSRQALLRIAGAAEQLRTWTPLQGSFGEWNRSVLEESHATDVSSDAADYASFTELDSFSTIASFVPAALGHIALPRDAHTQDQSLVAPLWNDYSDVVRRYLATKAFASWTAYQARGIRTLVAELFASELVLRVEAIRACSAASTPLDTDRLIAAIRASDLLLMHLVERSTFMAWLGRVERPSARRAVFRKRGA